jgi:ribonuclease P/MRP protein subunit POP8
LFNFNLIYAMTSNLEDTAMANTTLASSIGAASKSKPSKESKSRELYSSTIGRPPFAYAQIEVVQSQVSSDALDALQVRSYCDAALRQFLGATGAAMPLDMLKLDGNEFWVRLPREDMGLFAAALAAWNGVSRSGTATVLRLKASSNWLGSLVGRSEQQALWSDVAT